MQSMGSTLGDLVSKRGLWLVPLLPNWARHLCIKHFGLETTATVLSAQPYEEDGDFFLTGYYAYTDSQGKTHEVDFTICMYGPGNDPWWALMQQYQQGTQKRMRYLRWLPALHEMQDSL